MIEAEIEGDVGVGGVIRLFKGLGRKRRWINDFIVLYNVYSYNNRQ